MSTAKKITFERLGRIDWEDTADIFHGDLLVGPLARFTYQPSYPMELQSAPCGYEVAIDLDGEEVKKGFDVAGLRLQRGWADPRRRLSVGDYPNARAALNAAKRWARETIRAGGTV